MRRELTLAIIGAGLVAALVLARRGTTGAQQTLDLDVNSWFPGEEGGNAFLLDTAQLDTAPGFFSELINMADPSPIEAREHPNVQAFLKMIGDFEGGPEGYNALFGGGRFESFADHPRILVKKSGYASTAAGRYQILRGTWDDIRDKIEAPDFTPYWQDVAAVYLIRRRGALVDVINGNFRAALEKVAKEWASLPGAGYGQPERSFNDALASYTGAGGDTGGMVA